MKIAVLQLTDQSTQFRTDLCLCISVHTLKTHVNNFVTQLQHQKVTKESKMHNLSLLLFSISRNMKNTVQSDIKQRKRLQQKLFFLKTYKLK